MVYYMEENNFNVQATVPAENKPVLDVETFRAIMAAHKRWVMMDGK